jgi:hypothetical protein
VSPTFNHHPIETAFEQLRQTGNTPGLILVAQTDFLWPHAPVPQWVVGRSWPVSLKGYLGKMNELKSQPWLPRLHDLLFWYKMDHKAYKMATGVLAITNKLSNDLKQLGYNSQRLYPCVDIPSANMHKPKENKLRLLTAALHLGDKRKHIGWMMQALKPLNRQGISFEITLVGEFDTQIEQAFRMDFPQVKLTGRITRQALLGEMANHDIFLFTSLQENWGYVLIEAIAQGMVVFTPDRYPFSEINNCKMARFEMGNTTSFQRELFKILKEPDLLSVCLKQQRQFLDLVSYRAFVSRLSEIVN